MTEYTDVKWIKLMTGLFDSEKIQLIESMPEADSILVIWVKLLCLAGKINNGGVFVMGESLIYTEEMLSTVLRRPERRIRQALEVFEQLDMVRRIDGVLTLPNWSRYQNLDSMEKRRDFMRDYMRDYRQRQRSIAESAALSPPEDSPQTEGEEKPRKTSPSPPGEVNGKVNSKVNSKVNGKVNGKVHGKLQEQNREEQNREEQNREEQNREEQRRPSGKRGEREVFREFAGEDEELLAALRDFDLMRRAVRKPMTDRARELLCQKLLTFPEQQRLAVLEQSIAHSWTDLYPLEERKSSGSPAPASGRYGESFYAAARSLMNGGT